MTEKLIAVGKSEPWVRRLTLPAYQVNDAARYARISTQTIRNWQKQDGNSTPALAHRAKRASLSYFQLVEVAFVSVLRNLGLSLATIKDARDYMAQQLHAEFPFVQHRFKTDGQRIMMDLPQMVKGTSKDKLIVVNKGGQLAWQQILQHKFDEFDYTKGLAVRWRVAGQGSPIIIDPQIAFGAPSVKGVPTWAISGRQRAGESIEDIAGDFDIPVSDVRKALQFEEASEALTA